MKYRNVLLMGLYCCLGLACTNASNESNVQGNQVALDGGGVTGEDIVEDVDAGIAGASPSTGIRDAGEDSEDVRPSQRDSGVANNRCTVADLVYLTEPKDSNGACTDSCDSDSIEFLGKVYNPCSNTIEFTTNNSCIVSHWVWQKNGEADSAPRRLSPMCGQAITTHRLEGGDTKEQSSGLIPRMTAGSWRLTTTFSSFSSGNAISVSPEGAEASVIFSSL